MSTEMINILLCLIDSMYATTSARSLLSRRRNGSDVDVEDKLLC